MKFNYVLMAKHAQISLNQH